MCDIPIKFLGKETRDLLSALLNPKKIIPNEKGLSRDWHGLAELCGIGGEKIPNIERSNDPALKVLKIWSEKNKNDSTIDKLLSFLQLLDRFDVVDDITPLIEKDVDYYRANPNGYTVETPDIDDRDIITYDDAERKREGLPPQTYDAFVLFDNDDITFATEIIQIMEGQYNMRLCVKDRDVVGGESNHDSVIQLMSKRCNRVIVVVSSSFLESPTNKYFYALAQVEGIEKQRRKIIPCLYKKCPDLPLEFSAYHLLDYTRNCELYGNFWDKLYRSLKGVAPPSPSPRLTPQKIEDHKEKEVDATKSSNHVKFAISELDPETKEETEYTPTMVDSLLTEAPSINSVSSQSTESSNAEFRKQKSFLTKCRKFFNHKIEKKAIEEKSEVPQINDLVQKKKKFWKSNKLKVAVAN
nr:Myd88 protein [Altica viridicyanea]